MIPQVRLGLSLGPSAILHQLSSSYKYLAESVKLRFAVCCLSNSNDSCVVPSGNVGRGTSPFILVQLSFDLEAIIIPGLAFHRSSPVSHSMPQ